MTIVSFNVCFFKITKLSLYTLLCTGYIFHLIDNFSTHIEEQVRHMQLQQVDRTEILQIGNRNTQLVKKRQY